MVTLHLPAASPCLSHIALAGRTHRCSVEMPSPSPPCSPQCLNTRSVPGIAGSRVPKGKSFGAALHQPEGEGFPGREPSLPARLSSSRVSGLLLAAWRQPSPARGQGATFLLTHFFLPILYPNFQFGEVNMQFFPSL